MTSLFIFHVCVKSTSYENYIVYDEPTLMANSFLLDNHMAIRGYSSWVGWGCVAVAARRKRLNRLTAPL